MIIPIFLLTRLLDIFSTYLVLNKLPPLKEFILGFAILGVLVVLRPLMIIWLYGIPLPMFLAGIVWLFIDLFGVFYPSRLEFTAVILVLLQKKQKEKFLLNTFLQILQETYT